MSRFVSGGTDEQPTERDDAWVKAQQDLDAKHLARLDAAKQDGSGKSLYETLQANKAAKQEAFDEKAKLSNQFQNLNEDEVAFLDEVLQSTREKERSVKRETSEQLLAFKRQQEEAEKVARESESAASDLAAEAWVIGPRKRKKEREREGFGGLVKVRKTSSAMADGASASPPAQSPTEASGAASPPSLTGKKTDDVTHRTIDNVAPGPVTASLPASTTPSPPPPPKLGIVAYSSDEDE